MEVSIKYIQIHKYKYKNIYKNDIYKYIQYITYNIQYTIYNTAGPRVCLGFRLALIEAIVVVGRLLQATDITMVDGEKPIPFYYPVTLGFKGDLPATLNLKKHDIQYTM